MEWNAVFKLVCRIWEFTERNCFAVISNTIHWISIEQILMYFVFLHGSFLAQQTQHCISICWTVIKNDRAYIVGYNTNLNYYFFKKHRNENWIYKFSKFTNMFIQHSHSKRIRWEKQLKWFSKNPCTEKFKKQKFAQIAHDLNSGLAKRYFWTALRIEVLMMFIDGFW